MKKVEVSFGKILASNFFTFLFIGIFHIPVIAPILNLF